MSPFHFLYVPLLKAVFDNFSNSLFAYGFRGKYLLRWSQNMTLMMFASIPAQVGSRVLLHWSFKLHLLHKITLGLVRTVLAFFIYLEEDRTGSGLDDSERALL